MFRKSLILPTVSLSILICEKSGLQILMLTTAELQIAFPFGQRPLARLNCGYQ